MQIESLSIERRPSYDSDYPNQLVGLLKVKSNLGSQEIRVSNKGLAAIFQLLTEEICGTARENAARVKGAMTEAMHEPLIAAASRVKVIE